MCVREIEMVHESANYLKLLLNSNLDSQFVVFTDNLMSFFKPINLVHRIVICRKHQTNLKYFIKPYFS